MELPDITPPTSGKASVSNTTSVSHQPSADSAPTPNTKRKREDIDMADVEMTDAGASASAAPKMKSNKAAAGVEAGEKKRFEVKKVRLATTTR